MLGESSCELGVVTEAQTDALEALTEPESWPALLDPRFCGSACDAVREFAAHPAESAHQLDVELVTTEDWPLPPRDTMGTVAPRLGEQELAALSAARNIVVVHTHSKTEPTHLGFRTCVALTAAIAEKLHGFVYDEALRRIETAADFRTHLFPGRMDEPSFRPGHIVLQSYTEESGEERMLTLGMARFGTPDLEARGFSPESAPRVALLLNAVAGALADGAHASPIPIATDDVARVNGLPEKDITTRPSMGEVTLVPQETHTAGDPDNALLTLVPQGEAAGKPMLAWERLLLATTGGEARGGGNPTLRLTEEVPELMEIGKRVRSDLPRIVATYKDHLHLKARFKTDGGAEVMWILVTSCREGACSGTLENQPVSAPLLSLGQLLTVQWADVEDYLYTLPDGGSVGGESARIIERHGHAPH
jgi:uncharacterized protein YegJ (DUF2314 family)